MILRKRLWFRLFCIYVSPSFSYPVPTSQVSVQQSSSSLKKEFLQLLIPHIRLPLHSLSLLQSPERECLYSWWTKRYWLIGHYFAWKSFTFTKFTRISSSAVCAPLVGSFELLAWFTFGFGCISFFLASNFSILEYRSYLDILPALKCSLLSLWRPQRQCHPQTMCSHCLSASLSPRTRRIRNQDLPCNVLCKLPLTSRPIF